MKLTAFSGPVLLLLGTLAALRADDTSKASTKPNIVILLADDFGVGDIRAHYPGNKIPTPHLDRLVRQGRSFTDAHSSSAVCSPTRYGLLTGRYNWRTRLQEWVIAAYEPPLIAEDRPTLPGFLQQHGYHTACVGKWHLGWEWPGPQRNRMTEKHNAQASLDWDFTQPIGGGPTQRGFDYYFGVDLPNLPPFTYIENDRVLIQPTAKFQPDPSEGVVLPNGFAGAPAAPNWRMQDILPEITRRAVRYVHERAKHKQPFFLYFAMTSPHEPIVPSKDFQGQSGIAPIADFVMETDWSAGQVIQAIDEAGLADDTLVVFTADNGHSHYTGWQQLVAAGHQPSGPYRGHKGDIWEGGHRVPLVVRWPGRVEPGSTSSQMVCLTDLFATSAEIVGAQPPADGAEDSSSFLPSLLGKTDTDGRTRLVSHSNFGEFAYRDGPWKLVWRLSERNLEQSRGKPTVAELYNLDSDVGEQTDLSEANRDIVERMTKDLRTLIERGTSRAGQQAANDTLVQFETTQPARWAPALHKPFTHPGVLHSRAELDFVRAQVAGGEQPWKAAWEELRSHAISKLDWKPEPAKDVVRGAYNNPDIGGTEFMCAASAAYSHAIQWYISGAKPHADKAIEILNAYATTLESVGGHDAKLLVGMAGINFVNAAEIVRHTRAGWASDDQNQFERLLRTVFYPIIKDFYPTANGNWDAAMIQTMLAMGVFLDDREMFQRAANYYLNGQGNGAIRNYINDFGECQESGRDQAHTQMGLGYLGCAAEIAWQQGVDLYGAFDNRLALGFEYTAKYNLGHDVPYEPYRSHAGRYDYPAISDKARGRFSSIYERVYHHYHDRRALEMPFTGQVVEKIRPEPWQTAFASWGTLMYAGQPVSEQDARNGDRRLRSR